MSDKRFPNETDAYRTARNALLESESELRTLIEKVAAQRRALPPGGGIAEDYRFTEHGPDGEREVRLSELFDPGKDSLILYGWMFGPDMAEPCAMCTPFLDGLDGEAPHLTRRTSLAICARSPIDRLMTTARDRGWRNLRVISSAGSDFARDYWAEAPDGGQLPMANVFRRVDGRIHHHWATELLFQPFETGAPRHVDMLWGLWNALDLIPEGRGTDWMPQISYRD